MIHEELSGAIPVRVERRGVINLRLETVDQVVAEIERSDPEACWLSSWSTPLGRFVRSSLMKRSTRH